MKPLGLTDVVLTLLHIWLRSDSIGGDQFRCFNKMATSPARQWSEYVLVISKRCATRSTIRESGLPLC
jgi:hypothetical protein